MKKMYMSNNSKDVIRTLVGLKSRITPFHSRFTLVALSLCTLLLLGGFVTRAWATNPVPVYNGSTWYSLYDYTTVYTNEGKTGLSNNRNNTKFHTVSLVPPTTGASNNLTLQWKKGSKWPGCDIWVNGSTIASSGATKNEHLNLENANATIEVDATFFELGIHVSSNTGTVQNLKIPMAKHIRVNDGTTEGASVGKTSFSKTLDAIVYGNTSAAYHIDLRSFLMQNDNLTYTSSNSEFHFGGGLTTKSYAVKANSCAYGSGESGYDCTNSSKVGILGNPDSYEVDVYFTPSANVNAQRNCTITIKDGNVERATVILTAKVIPTYYFKATSVATDGTSTLDIPVKASFTNGEYSGSTLTISQTAATADVASLTKRAYFYAPASSGGYQFQGWYTNAACTSDRVSTDNTIYYDITSSGLTSGTAVEKKYYAKYLESITAEFENEGSHDLEVGDTYESISYSRTSSATATDDDEDEENFFWYEIVDNTPAGITTGSDNADKIISYNPSTKVVTAHNAGTATLRLHQRAHGLYEAVDAEYEFTVSKKTNALKCAWNNGSAGDDWDENMNFDSKLPVKFSSSNTSGPAISVTPSPASAVATFKNGAGGANPDTIITNHREGTVTWTVRQAEDYKYFGDEMTCSVIVGTIPSPGCRVLVEKDQHAVGLYDNSGGLEYSLSCKGNMLYFKAGKYSNAATGELNVYGYNTLGTELFHETYGVGSLSTSGVDEEIDISNKEVVKIKFKAGNTISKWFSDVYVSRKVWLTLENEGGSAISEIDMPVNTIGGNVTRNTFYIDYSTCASKIKLVSNNSRIKFAANNSTTYEFDVENGTRKAIELTYTSPADAEEIEATITVYTPYEHETLTVNAETKGLLSTTLEYIGTLSYGVDHANMNATELFQVRDENGDLVASPVITLSSNATGVINTVSENRAIDFLCGGSASITASYAGDDVTYAAATNNGISMPITVNKLADVITWGNVQEDGKIHVWADSDVPSSIASANTTINSYVSGNNDRLIVSGSAGSFTLHAGQHGEVTLNATSAGDCTYNTTSDTKTIVVEPCFHNIVWTQNFMALTATREGVINEEFELDAYAVDSSNVATNVTINYSLKIGTIASLDGTTLTVSGVGIDTLIATTVADNKYAVATSMKIIRVRREGEPCNSYALNVSEEKRFSKIGDNDYVIDGLPNHLSCQVKKLTAITITGTNAYIKGWSKKQNDWVPLKQIYEQVDNTSWTDLTYDFTDEQSRDITKIKFTNSIEDGSKYVRNVLVTQRTYFTADVSNINRTASPIMVNEPFTQDIVVSYSDVPHIQYSLVGDVTEYLTLEPTETITNDCGDYGTYTFRLSGTFPKVKAYSTSHIYIYHSAGDTIDIPVNVTIACNGTFKFINSDGEWGTSEKWTCGGSTEHGLLPTLSSEVEIKKTVTVTGQGSAYMVDLSDANAKLIIMPGAGLTIGAGGIVGATAEKLILKAGTEGVTKGQTGYLRISPDYTGEMPSADVEFYSTVHYNTNLSGDGAATYQCVGAPVEGVLAKTVFTPGSYLYTWDEGQDGWVSSRTKLTFEAFKGFEVTQKKVAAGLGFEYAGQLISVSGVKTIDLDYSDPRKGYNLLANSFTAPIEIAQFRAGDFINANQTIYILNAGTKNNSDNPGESVDAPGKWIGMPIATVEKLDSVYPRMIAPMQGFWIKATGASPQLKLDYSRLVWGVDYSGDRANKPLRAPKRDAEMDEEMPITGKLQVSLYSETERDFFFMLESERYDAAYENGYDAPKIPSGSMDVFTVEGENELGVDATNSIIGTRVGVRTGGESVYTFVFSHLSGEHEWALYDHETGDKTDINEGTEYMFFAEPYSLLNGRFEIVERADAPSVTTGVDGADNEVKAYKFIKDNQLYILKNGVLYNVMGGVVR